MNAQSFALRLEPLVTPKKVELRLIHPDYGDLYRITIDPKKGKGMVGKEHSQRIIELTDFFQGQAWGSSGANLVAQSICFWLTRIQRAFFPQRIKWPPPPGSPFFSTRKNSQIEFSFFPDVEREDFVDVISPLPGLGCSGRFRLHD